jgi:hypothetical protein
MIGPGTRTFFTGKLGYALDWLSLDEASVAPNLFCPQNLNLA